MGKILGICNIGWVLLIMSKGYSKNFFKFLKKNPLNDLKHPKNPKKEKDLGNPSKS